MKGRRLIVAGLLCSLFLVGCSGNNSATNDKPVATEKTKKRNVKHETTDMPILFYKKSNYNINAGLDNTFEKTLVSVTTEDFTEENEIKIIDQFKGREFIRAIDFSNSKLVTLTLEKKLLTDDENKKAHDNFRLIKGTDFVIGKDVIGNFDQVIAEQLAFVTSIEGGLKRSYDETGFIYFAIPKEYIKTKNLQLRIVTDIDKQKEFMYVDIE